MVELNDVEVFSLHPRQTLFDFGHDVLAGENVRAALPANRAAAFTGEVIFATAMADIAADPFLAQPVIDRRVDVIDAAIEHLVKNGLGLRLGDVAGRGAPRNSIAP